MSSDDASSDDAPDDDVSLFRQSIGAVRPIRHDYTLSRPPPPRARRLQKADDSEFEALIDDHLDVPEDRSSGEFLHFRRNGVQIQTVRKLRRGYYRIENELDLHGLNVEQARTEVKIFLHTCRDTGQRCVRIITGKGSPEEPGKIRAMLDYWLRGRQEVIAFSAAQPAHGGSGALLLLLRATQKP